MDDKGKMNKRDRDLPPEGAEWYSEEYQEWWLNRNLKLEQWQVDRMLIELARLLINTKTRDQLYAFDKWLNSHVIHQEEE